MLLVIDLKTRERATEVAMLASAKLPRTCQLKSGGFRHLIMFFRKVLIELLILRRFI